MTGILSVAALAATAVTSAYVNADNQFVTLCTEKAKASAKIALDGARVVSFRVGGDEVIWNTRVPGRPQASWNHGGIPVCWPWFGSSGGHGKDSMHGFAKSSRFEVVATSAGNDRAQAVLRLRSDERTRQIWPHDFELIYEATLTDTLRLSLLTVNTGTTPFSFTAGFHPYFRLGDRSKARVTGTDGLRFCDSRVKMTLDETWRGDLDLSASAGYDHVFDEKGASAVHMIVDPSLGRRICETSSGVTRLVIWTPEEKEEAEDNPGPGKLGVGDWRYFACVEPAFLWDGREITLHPGERQQFDFEISVLPIK